MTSLVLAPDFQGLFCTHHRISCQPGLSPGSRQGHGDTISSRADCSSSGNGWDLLQPTYSANDLFGTRPSPPRGIGSRRPVVFEHPDIMIRLGLRKALALRSGLNSCAGLNSTSTTRSHALYLSMDCPRQQRIQCNLTRHSQRRSTRSPSLSSNPVESQKAIQISR
ncbi:hypothetical protein VTI74DRAFT_10714 [Chaetomium olivicolor]